ncbi:MAG: iron-sulfur cluster loop [Nanoarchaeota archaeon]|nr:iron-sulfur cluster loop [Nanoarchaeota archaeon]
MKSQERITEILIEKGNKLLKAEREFVEFTKDKEADKLMNDIEHNPHIFVLACVMDRQIPAERAWRIPYLISQEIGGYEFEKFLNLKKEQIKEIFNKKKLHRFNDEMAENFYLAIQKIHKDYDNDASNIWKGNQKSATIVRRFLEFRGMGVKIATMTANILARNFKIPMEDYICIDISPDVHIKRVFKRIGYIGEDSSNDELLYKARELNPIYPGIFDLSCWEIGREWCRPTNPKCEQCYLNEHCEKNM